MPRIANRYPRHEGQEIFLYEVAESNATGLSSVITTDMEAGTYYHITRAVQNKSVKMVFIALRRYE
jgi:hypothetical protein